MTQVIACSIPEGIALATDSLATWFDQTRGMRHFNLKKILRLSSHAALISAGIGIGVEMGLAFRQFLQERRAGGIEEMIQWAPPFFTDQYGKYLGQRGEEAYLSQSVAESQRDDSFPLKGIYFILAGYSFKDLRQPYRLTLLGIEESEVSIKIFPTSHILVVPRSLTMEKKLDVQCKEGPSLGGLLSLCKSFLRNRSAGEEVGPPFYFATITRSGFKEIHEEEVDE